MPSIQWSSRFNVGVALFDQEHQQLVAMLNALVEQVRGGAGKEALGRGLDAFIDYALAHFANEERLLERHAFPGFAEHRAEHVALAAQVRELQLRYRSGATTTLSLEVLTFLRNWLLKHIRGSDRKYGAFLVARERVEADRAD
jgi:hemerythrin